MSLTVERERKYVVPSHEAEGLIVNEDPVTIEQSYVSQPYEAPELRVRKETFTNERERLTATLKLGNLPLREELEVTISGNAYEHWLLKGHNAIRKQRYHLPHMAGRLSLDQLTVGDSPTWLAELENGTDRQEKSLARRWQDVTHDQRYKNRNIGIARYSPAESQTDQESVIQDIIAHQATQSRPLVIGVAGGSGSGKTTFAKELAERTGGLLISTDDYYRGKTYMSRAFGYELTDINWDHPEAWNLRYIAEQLGELANGHTIEKPLYSMVEFEPLPELEEVSATEQRPIIAEGLYTLHPDIEDVLDQKIFVDAPAATRIARRIIRDTTIRKIAWPAEDNFRYCMEVVEPTFDEHGAKQKVTAGTVIRT